MGVFTFVLRTSGGEWNTKQHNGELEAFAASAYELQRKLVQTILSSDSSCGVQTSYSAVSPTSAVFQVVVGGVSGGGAFIGGGAAAAAPSSGPDAAAEAPPAEEKKEEEGESDDDLGIDLFD